MSNADLTPRILITRLSAIGDCILTLPLACAVRDHFPKSMLAWVVEPLAATLIDRHQAVDEFIVVPKGWIKSPRRVRTLRRRLRDMQFDYVLDPQSLTKSSLLGWLSGASRRIGFATPRGRELAPWLNNERIEVGDAHLVDATLRLLEPLGIERPDVRFNVPVQRELETGVDQYMRDAHLSQGYLVINCAASRAARLWPAERFGRVARFLGEEHDLPSVVTWAGPLEAEMAARIVAKSGGHAILAPNTSLSELAALLRRARFMMGSDTGPLHLAAAVGTPCLGLYGPTRAARSGPYGTQHYTIECDAPRVRGRRKRRTDDSAMRQISVEAVCEACTELLCRPTSQYGSRSNAA